MAAAAGCGDSDGASVSGGTESDGGTTEATGGGTSGTPTTSATSGGPTSATTSATATSASSTDPGTTATSATTEPGTTAPTTTDASSTDPGTTAPGTTDPGSTTEGSTTDATGTDTDPFMPGEPLDPAPNLQWTYVEIPGAQCRNGSQAGFAYRLNSASDNLAIYFEGGGACFNNFTCLANPDSVGNGSKDGRDTGILDADDARNPLRDYNWVYVPYCTGDVFAGTRANANVANGPQNQQFVGYLNTELFLQRIVPTFEGATQVVVTGESAGGFGAALNYHRIARLFISRGSKVALLDDSGPAMDDPYMTPCLQQQWRDLWGLDAALPADCAGCFASNGGGLVNYLDYLVDTFPNERMGLVSASRDTVIRTFFAYGLNNCNAGLIPSYPADQFEEGLYDLVDNWLAVAPQNWGAYVVSSTSHTWIGGGGFYTTEVDGVPLYQWVDDLLNASPAVVDPR
jgi:hypothetical protein